MKATEASEQLIHVIRLSSMPCDLEHFRDSDIDHSVPSHLQHFGLTQRQVSNEMPNTPMSAGVNENFLG